MAVETLLADRRDGVLTLTLNRPDRLNAADRATAAALRDALIAARDDDGVRAIVLTGAGRGFCTGADLSGDAPQPPWSRTARKAPLYEYGQVTRAIDDVDKPVIAAVNGVAAGAGLSFATACDRRIAAASARFAAIFVRRGLVPDAGISYFLPRLVGVAAATDLLLTGRVIDAEEARTIGLADEVVPDAEVAVRAHAYAAALAAGASIAVDLARRAARRSFDHPLQDAITFESWAQDVAQATEDVREGISAFRERREPVFKGR